MAECDGCGHREEAPLLLISGSKDEAREQDRAEWERLAAAGDCRLRGQLRRGVRRDVAEA